MLRNKFIKLVSILLVITLTIPFIPINLVVFAEDGQTYADSDLVLHVDFNESNRDSAQVFDLSGKDNHGDIAGNVTFVEGVSGEAAYFDNGAKAGSTTVGDTYINFGKPSDLTFGDENFSTILWVKAFNGGRSNSTILSNKDYHSGSNKGFAIADLSGTPIKKHIVNFTAAGASRVDIEGIASNDGDWHQIAVTFDRSGYMIAYLDGVEYKRMSVIKKSGYSSSTDMTEEDSVNSDLIPEKPENDVLTLGESSENSEVAGESPVGITRELVAYSIDTGLDLVLGADGKKTYAASNTAVDDLRIYRSALGKEEVELIHAYDGIELNLNNMLNKVLLMSPDDEVSQADIDALADKIRVKILLASTLTPEECLAVTNELKADYNSLELGGTPLMSFAAVSDIHIADKTNANAVAFTKGLADMKALGVDGFVNMGDNTNSGSQSQQDAFWSLFNTGNPVEAGNVINALGNHDVRDASPNWSNDPGATTPFYDNFAKGYYMTANAPYMPDTNGKIYFDKWINGYHFAVINPEKGLKDSTYMTDEQVQWLEDTLRQNTEDGKPNFLVVHQAFKDSHWRSNILNSFGHNDTAVKEILKKYPQTIVLSGHIHNSFGVAEVVDREHGTLVDMPAFSPNDVGLAGNGLGYYVAIYENRVVFKARNFATSTWLPEYDQIVYNDSLPVAYGKAVEESKNSHSPESWNDVQVKMNEAKVILETKYDQSVITGWNDYREPTAYIFTKEKRQVNAELAGELLENLENVVTVPNTPFDLKEDAYLQAGANSSTVPSGYANYQDGYLRVKNSDNDADQRYTRKTVVTFDLVGADISQHNQAVLALTLGTTVTTGNPGRHFANGEVYKIDSGWSLSNITWDGITGREKIAEFNGLNIVDGKLEINLTTAVFEAIEAGKTEISFEISVPTQASDNLMDFYSSRNVSNGDKAPLLELRNEAVADPIYSEIRESWKEFILGGSLDSTNETIEKYVESVDSDGAENWDTMDKSDSRTHLWPDLDLTPFALNNVSQGAKERSGNVAITYYRIEAIAKAYFTEGTSLYQKAEVKTEVIKALDFMYANVYNEKSSQTQFYGNWWHWEIGAPISSLTTALMFYDDLTPAQIANYVAAVERYTAVADRPSGYPGSPQMTGANLIDKATAVTLAGILSDNQNKLTHVKTAIKSVFEYVTTGDGFYEDGSFIQHQALAFIGGYGKDLYTKLSILFVVLKDTEWELTYSDDAQNLAFDMIFKGIEPFYHDGRFMDMVSGRDIVRQEKNDRVRGVLITTALLPMRDAIPADQKDYFDSLMKTFLEADSDYFFENCSDITAVKTALEILNDSSIPTLESKKTNAFFGGMDKYVYSNGEYTLGLALHSNRTYGHELINDEGKQTWNVADGATYIYTNDKNQFSEGYWATIDPTRIPGTTVEHIVHPKGAADRQKNLYDWVGASVVGEYGSVGMQYKALGTGGGFNGADVKKSWFMLEDEIVAIGSGITSNTGNNVETIIDNKKIDTDNSNQFIVDGTSKDITTTSNAATSFVNPNWMYLGGSAGDGTGYYFLNDITVQALKENRDGDWINQSSVAGAANASYGTIYVDHGKNPRNADYAYVIVPLSTQSETEAKAQNSDIEILSNTPEIHAVSKPSKGFIGANFWNVAGGNIAGISTNAPSSISLERDGGVITIAVSDPTHKRTTPIRVEINTPVTGLVASDSNITILEQGSKVVIEVNATGKMGGTSTIGFSYDSAQETEVIEVVTPEEVRVPLFTTFDSLSLPTTVKVRTSDMQLHDVAVEWSQGDYNRTQVGTYTLSGKITLPAGVNNTNNIEAQIKISNGALKGETIEDTYVQGGNDKNKPGSNWMSVSLVAKYDADITEAGQAYTRKAIFKLDISQVPENATNILLNIEGTGAMGENFDFVDLFWVENDWAVNSVTFAGFPNRIKAEEIAKITKADLDQSLQREIDITDVIKEALELGMTELSLELSIPTAARNNLVHFHSTRSTTGAAPNLTWDIGISSDGEDNWNLEVLIQMAQNINPAEFQTFNQQNLQDAIDFAVAVLQNPSKTAEDVKMAELKLTREMSALRKVVAPVS